MSIATISKNLGLLAVSSGQLTGNSRLRRLPTATICAVLAVLCCSCQSLTTPPTSHRQSSAFMPTAGNGGYMTPPTPGANVPVAASPMATSPWAASPTWPSPTTAGYPLASTSTPSAYPVAQASYQPSALPPSAWTGVPQTLAGPGCSCCPPQQLAGEAPPSGCNGSDWKPPGIPCPWPYDEYLCDGGDKDTGVEVLRDWTVIGLDQEDTVAHFDTLSGKLVVEASNRVCVYAPRFGAVRRVDGMKIHEGRNRLAGVEQPTGPLQHEERMFASTATQPLQAERYLGIDTANTFREDTRSLGVDNALPLAVFRNRFKPYEDFQLIRRGVFDNSEKARLNQRIEAAQVWTGKQAVQVTIEGITPHMATGDTNLQQVYHYEMPPGKPRLRIVKVASTKQAKPGEEVEFTIRFDNVGNELIGNVTVIDNLTTRLEYVADSAECDLEASFFTQENEGDSLVLRWEIANPLDVGDGGVIRFKCRVR